MSIISVKHSRDTSIDRESPIRFSPGVPSFPPFPFFLCCHRNVGNESLAAAVPVPPTGCNNGIQLVPRVAFRRSLVRSFVRSNQMARWDLVARSLAVNEGGGGRRRYVARLLHPILRVYPIWPRRMTRRTHALDLAWATFAGGRFGPTIPRAPR